MAQASPLLLAGIAKAGVIAKVDSLTVHRSLSGKIKTCYIRLVRVSESDAPLPHFRGEVAGDSDFSETMVKAEFKLMLLDQATAI
jgi:hypothetical protein